MYKRTLVTSIVHQRFVQLSVSKPIVGEKNFQSNCGRATLEKSVLSPACHNLLQAPPRLREQLVLPKKQLETRLCTKQVPFEGLSGKLKLCLQEEDDNFH